MKSNKFFQKISPMKTLTYFSFVLLFLVIFPTAIFSQEINKVQVYYFHNTRRCETCMAIEEETKNALQEGFQDQMAEGTVIYSVYNFDDEANKKLIKDLKIEGQSLLVFKEGKRFDITDKGFLYARTDPEKFKQIVIETVGEM